MSAPRLHRLGAWPDGLERLKPREVRKAFPEPTLVTIEGRRPKPLFVSALLHGNETTGFQVVKALAARFRDAPPPRTLMVFVGNVAAAEQGERFLDGQPDYNRLWAGGETSEHALAAEVLDAARAAQPFASIDVHNNTGRNPLYGCVSDLSPTSLSLAALFSRIGVIYDNPKTTQSIAFSAICPAITLECGRPGVAANDERATQYVLDVLHLSEIDVRPAAFADLVLFRTIGRMVVDPDADFVFGDAEETPDILQIPVDIDSHNFSELPAGWPLARSAAPRSPLRVVDEEMADLTDAFFVREDGLIRLTRAVTPAMLTTSATIVRQDCLGYLMEPVELEAESG